MVGDSAMSDWDSSLSVILLFSNTSNTNPVQQTSPMDTSDEMPPAIPRHIMRRVSQCSRQVCDVAIAFVFPISNCFASKIDKLLLGIVAEIIIWVSMLRSSTTVKYF